MTCHRCVGSVCLCPLMPIPQAYCSEEVSKKRTANEIIRSSRNPWLGKNRSDYIVALLSNIHINDIMFPTSAVAERVVACANRIIELTEGT